MDCLVPSLTASFLIRLLHLKLLHLRLLHLLLLIGDDVEYVVYMAGNHLFRLLHILIP